MLATKPNNFAFMLAPIPCARAVSPPSNFDKPIPVDFWNACLPTALAADY
jgi:hypothetical protein